MRLANQRPSWQVALSISLALTTALLIACQDEAAEPESSRDLLAYAVGEGDATVYLYDQDRGEHLEILSGIDYLIFPQTLAFSADARLAYQLDGRVHVMNTLNPEQAPLTIEGSPGTFDWPAVWSPDGQRLVWTSHAEGETPQVYVWDGRNSVNITPASYVNVTSQYRDFSWSPDGSLLVYQASIDIETPTGRIWLNEIFLWNGRTSINISQNPRGNDTYPKWSPDGKLAWLSEADGQYYTMIVWDGQSYDAGRPDAASYSSVTAGLVDYFSVPYWTNDSELVFGMFPPGERHVALYRWDGQVTKRLTRDQDNHHCCAAWSQEGNWAYSNFFSAHLITVMDEHNHVLFTTEGQYSPAWSGSGELVYCHALWALSIWDDGQLVPVVEDGRHYIWAQWQHGGDVYCSSG